MLRLRTQKGTQPAKDVSPTSTVGQLRVAAAAAVGAPSLAGIVLKTGFPPKELVASDDDKVLAELGVRNGDVVIVESSAATATATTAAKAAMVRRIVPDDNSCLFTSVGYVLHDKSRTMAGALRALVAKHIEDNKELYDEALLGKANDEYVKWIRKNESWGGGVELAILAEHYKTEILAVDIQTLRIDRFGQGAGFTKAVFVIYNGIHFDALAVGVPGAEAAEASDQTVFDVGASLDSGLIPQAVAIAKKAHDNHEYTDLAKFDVQCAVCNVGLVGQKGVQEHALKSGHASFKEYTGGK